MRFEGQIYKPSGRKNTYWSVEIPLLHIHTQGKSRRDALNMAKDAVESLVYTKGFKVFIHPGEGDTFTISANELKTLIAFMLRRQREFQDLTVREVAARLHSRSPNSYAQYERGSISPSMDKLIQLLHAIDPDFEPVLKAS